MQRNIVLLFLIRTSHWFFLVMPVIIPFYHACGLSVAEIMTLQAGFSAATLFLEIPSGYFSDVWGRRRTLIVGSLISSVGWAIYCFSSGFWPFLLAEVVMGIGQSFVSGTDSALLYDSLQVLRKEEEYTLYEGRVSSAGNFSEALAGMIGGYLAFVSLYMPFYGQAVVSLVGLFSSFFLTEPPVSLFRYPSFPEVWKVVKDTVFRDKRLSLRIWFSSLVGSATLTMAWMAQSCFLYIHLPMKIWGGAVNLYSILWTLLNLFVGLAALKAYQADRYFGEQKLSLLIWIGVVAGFAGVGAVPNYFMLLFMFLFYGVRGIATPVLKDYIQRITFSEIRATVLSVRNFIIRILFSCTGPLLGKIADTWHIPSAMWVAAAFYFMTGGIILMLMDRSSSKMEQRVADGPGD